MMSNTQDNLAATEVVNIDFKVENAKYDIFGALKKEVKEESSASSQPLNDLELAIQQSMLFKHTMSKETEAMISTLDCY